MMTPLQAAEYTAGELKKKVLELEPAVAVFDCDGTLWDGDAGLGFLNWSLEQGIVSRSTSAWIDARHRAYRAGEVSEVKICGEMVQIYAGLRDAELRQTAARYVREFVTPRIFPEIADLVAALRERGTQLWAVSSTNKWIIVEALRSFSIPEERVCAAEVAIVDGVVTETLIDVPTDEGKAATLVRIGLQRPDAVFGNSIHDLAMLEMAAQPFPINPTPGLLEAAAQRGWTCFRPAGATTALNDVTGN
ncbi:MAG: HAD family hydrolase [Acidobacteriota bacterium]